jgi:hypothetical protein
MATATKKTMKKARGYGLSMVAGTGFESEGEDVI